MHALEVKFQCLSLAGGNVDAAKTMLEWLMEPMPEADAAKFAPTQTTATQPAIPPSGTARA